MAVNKNQIYFITTYAQRPCKSYDGTERERVSTAKQLLRAQPFRLTDIIINIIQTACVGFNQICFPTAGREKHQQQQQPFP